VSSPVEACVALQVCVGDEKSREIIATRIIDLARDGAVKAGPRVAISSE
jgi:hypothetical protein